MSYKIIGGGTLVLTVIAVGVYYFSLNSNKTIEVSTKQVDRKVAKKELSPNKIETNKEIRKISKARKKDINKSRVADKKLDEIAKDLDKINQDAPFYIMEAKNQLALIDEQYEDLQNEMNNVDKMLEPTNKELGIDIHTIEQEIEEGFNKPATSPRGKQIQKELDKTEDILNNIEKSLDKLSQQEEQ